MRYVRSVCKDTLQSLCSAKVCYRLSSITSVCIFMGSCISARHRESVRMPRADSPLIPCTDEKKSTRQQESVHSMRTDSVLTRADETRCTQRWESVRGIVWGNASRMPTPQQITLQSQHFLCRLLALKGHLTRSSASCIQQREVHRIQDKNLRSCS